MKKKLLFLAIVLLSVLKGFAQAEAYQAPDIHQCGNEVFNLSVQTPIILGNQSPDEFTVTYHLSEADAEAGVNPVADPNFYVSPPSKVLFARVTNNSNEEDYAVSSFTLTWTSGVFVPDMPDVVACDSYELSMIEVGQYYLSPGGVDLLPFGTVITATQTVYVYKENDEGCSDESEFTVTIQQTPEFNTPEPLYACDINNDGFEVFNLNDVIPPITAGVNIIFDSYNFYITLEDAQAGANAIPNSEAFVNAIPNQIIYVAINSGSCRWVSSFQIIVIQCNNSSISGFVSLNLDGNCDTFELAASGIPVYYTHNDETYIAYTNADGYYNFINVPDGEVTVYVPAAATSTVLPSEHVITMPGNEEEVNFCISPDLSQVINDVAVSFIPITQARPGFVASYAVMYQNLGTMTQEGNISIQFDDTKLTFLDATPVMVQSGNMLTLSYSNLLPFQSKVSVVNFTVMLPQIVPAGAVLNFTATVTSTVPNLTPDVNPDNNTSIVDQIVTNSYDPNDISVREGELITEAQADDYLTYTIRFQNKGSANAEDVRIETVLDENLEWSTFEAISASDAFTVKHTGNKIEFMFKGIDLPFKNADEPGSHGHVIYRIKPKADVTVGDIMSAQADIYFDFNDVIETDTIHTMVQATAGLHNNEISSFTVYPNPASGDVNLILTDSSSSFEVIVTDVLGKTVLNADYQNNEGTMDISLLRSGVYFVNVTASGKQQTKKLIVK